MRKEKSLGTDELGCLAEYLIFHLALQDKGNNPRSCINIYKNVIIFPSQNL